MNYTELIKRFWQLHELYQFSVTEIALYFHLIEICNRCSWANPFNRNNSRICADLGVSINTLKNARNRLSQAGLIQFSGRRGTAKLTYKLSTSSKFDEVSIEVGDEGITNVKPEKEKQQEEKKEKENFPPHPLYKEKEKKEEEKKERGDWNNAHAHTRAYTREEATLFFDGIDGCYKQQKTDSDANPLSPPAPLSPVEAFRAALKKRFKFDFSMVEEEFLPIVSDWLEYKQGRSEKYKTQKSFELLCAKIIKLSEGDAETARAIIEQSMANNWAGLFTLKDDNNTNTKSITNGQRTYKSFDQIQREETDRACAEHLARQLEKIALKDMERQW